MKLVGLKTIKSGLEYSPFASSIYIAIINVVIHGDPVLIVLPKDRGHNLNLYLTIKSYNGKIALYHIWQENKWIFVIFKTSTNVTQIVIGNFWNLNNKVK